MVWLLPLLSFALASLATSAISKQTPGPYVVYMGSSTDGARERNPGSSLSSHLEMLATVIPREEGERVFVGHSYHKTFRGFSAVLTEAEARRLSGHPGVVSVFPDRVLQLHTTRSWAFLEAEAGPGRGGSAVELQTTFFCPADNAASSAGIWPESPSFSDAGIGAVPSRWRGPASRDPISRNLTATADRSKVLHQPGEPLRPTGNASRFRADGAGSPRDTVGHGTHTASTAAGAVVFNASYYGLARGVAKGGSPSSRLAVYKACSAGGCASSNILKAIDDAVDDGVDIISISIGISSIFQSDFLKGVLVVCSGGNDGPDPYTVINSAPWILTVAASSIDRTFQSSIVLGNGNRLKGNAINFSNQTGSRLHPLIFGGDAASDFTPVFEASNCYPGSLDSEKAAGKIVVCVESDPTVTRRVKKLVAEGAGASGLIVIDNVEKGVSFDSGTFPFSEVGKRAGTQILRYINSTRSPRASILPSTDVDLFKPAPVVAYFSSRGPGSLTESILKPDIMAPGVGILAASVPPADGGPASGTSMACPHVAGTAAFLKSVRPRWTPSMLKSALMTTATTKNNVGRTITSVFGERASYHEMGAGEIGPLRAVNPGIVYETAASDYLLFLCYHGYKQQLISAVAGGNFTCPANSSDELISGINYPSISVAKLDPRRPPRAVTRTVTNVGPVNATYAATVSPPRLSFSGRSRRAAYEVSFDGSAAGKGYHFGHITWSDGVRSARSVFAVNVI
ncbi:unnamed protein product [Spirodela intermedia]|uniref:Uncharacterized protein n=1 Tax=Spirodela intermedia TaxID=51605 RepID=A0A7I8I9S5_SPIIN|nr:unnamed protein product [Spirodela intermedia]CAA6654457.1 unnamed protein product [Spirodela intermedia]